jgi:hypothetical protein
VGPGKFFFHVENQHSEKSESHFLKSFDEKDENYSTFLGYKLLPIVAQNNCFGSWPVDLRVLYSDLIFLKFPLVHFGND